MSHCIVPVTTVSNQVSFSHTGLGFGFPHAFSETFSLTSFVKFQADVAIV